MKKKIDTNKEEEKIQEIAEEKVLEIIEEEVKNKETAPKDLVLSSWKPKTKLGKEVQDGKIKDIDKILESGQKIMEEQIVDCLLTLKSDLISIGQSKGKFGGGKRRAWRQTQRKTKEGNIPTFSTLAVI